MREAHEDQHSPRGHQLHPGDGELARDRRLRHPVLQRDDEESVEGREREQAGDAANPSGANVIKLFTTVSYDFS